MTPDSPRQTVGHAQRLAAAAGLGRVDTVRQLAGGRNNRVYRLDLAGPGRPPVLMKAYFRSADDPRDRLHHEFAFSRFAWDRGIDHIPQPLHCDDPHGLALYRFAPGSMLAPGTVTEDHVDQALQLFIALNRYRDHPDATGLPDASEACFTDARHVELIGERVARLDAISDPAAAAFVADELRPRWDELRQSVSNTDNASLPGAEAGAVRCLSPSDFGFHNALADEDGRLTFHDFEYAGWDDPAKLIGDFFHQPRRPAPLSALPAFVSGVTAALDLGAEHAARFRRLLPLFGVKWACIVLNPLLPVGAKRRSFAGVNHPADDLINRARWVLNRTNFLPEP